ncbi:hypothetical protein JCM10914A_25710 [Paenibacillus sp. JCM 10914]|uniref:tryptophan-rich sensory protein n=1 Tax=Paenibacillus sp. JCM 10914 TaxID=1236974 RepID=UPI0003CCAE49|nr:tryptophan-rich sensory protein [Paenibacillus sp. JCM 10914]GAE09568.1 hypothetical protein JCM10914_5933 [Paenibacillus sp. JCM 10914]
MFRTNTYRWWNLLFFAGVIAMNALATSLPLGGRTPDEISDMYYTPITPAGYAFAIWSVVYITLLGFIIYQLLRGTSTRDSVLSIGPWFIISCVLNMAWLALWHSLLIEWSVVVMLLLLLSLWVLYRRTQRIDYPTNGERVFLKLPFALYIGWVSPAFLVNISVVMNKIDLFPLGLSEVVWGIILLIAGIVLALFISYPYRNSIVPLVFTWAYVAVAVEHRDTDSVFITAFILAVVLFLYAVWLFFTRNRRWSRY